MDSRLVLPVNTVLDGSYRILRLVGSGGFGVTYEAEDLNLGTMVAIKEYYPVDFGDRDARMNVRPKSERHKKTFDWGRENFLQEARTLARFEHPGIVRVTRVFEANSTAYMVMRFEQGLSFEAWLTSLGRPPTQEELDSVMAALLDALQVMHAANYLHRDIAPDNIIIRIDGTPVLLDFGAARRAVAEMSRSPAGIIKAGYSPHEQYSSDGRLQGPWSDLYALGATLYRAVTGRPPDEATLRVDDDHMPPATGVGKGKYRQDFLAAIDACLTVRHSDRPQSVAQLRPMLLGQGPQPRPGTGLLLETRTAPMNASQSPAIAPAARPVARRRLAMAAVILVVLGGVYGGYEITRWGAAQQQDDAKVGGKASADAAQRQAELGAESRRKEEERIAADAEARRKDATDAAEREAELDAERRRNRERADAAAAEARKADERASLVRSLQTALSRIGCYASDADGRWDAKGRAALEQFAKRTKLDVSTDEPTPAALYAVVARTGRVCPLECSEDTMESNGKCVPKARPAAPRAKESSTAAEPRAAATQGGYVTCGRNGCQTVPKGCYTIRHDGGGGRGGRIVCP